MEVALKVKDFIIDKDEIITQEKQTKTKKKISTEYNLLLENNIDFVLNKKTATTNKDLVFLVSQELFYFKHKNGKIEEINDSKLKSFFLQYSNKDQIFSKLGWWKDYMDDNLSRMRALIYSKELREFYKHNVFISYDQSKQWHHYMEKNSKLFLYAYQKIQSMGNRAGSKEQLYSNIFDIESELIKNALSENNYKLLNVMINCNMHNINNKKIKEFSKDMNIFTNLNYQSDLNFLNNQFSEE
jgi:hypothetical protein